MAVAVSCAGAGSAATRAADAVPNWSGGTSIYMFFNMDDYREIHRRLIRSSAARFLMDTFAGRLGGRELREALDFKELLSAETMALSVSFSEKTDRRIRAQMALTFAPDKRPVLDKIEKGAVSAAEFFELLGFPPSEEMGLSFDDLLIPPSKSNGIPYYMDSIFDTAITARKGVLLIADSAESLEACIAALGNRGPRVPARLAPKGNTFHLAMNKELTAELVRAMNDNETVTAESLKAGVTFDMALAMKDDGWGLDIATNVVELANPAIKQKMLVKKPGSFVSIGGMKPIVTLSSTPDLTRIASNRSTAGLVEKAVGKIARTYGKNLPFGTDTFVDMFFEAITANRDVMAALEGINLLNLSVSRKPSPGGEIELSPDNFGLLTYLGAKDPVAVDTLRKCIEPYVKIMSETSGDVADVSGALSPLGLDTMYTLEATAEESPAKLIPPLRVMFGKTAMAFGWQGGFEPGALGKPFADTTPAYDELNARADSYELIYADVATLRMLILTAAKQRGLWDHYSARRIYRMYTPLALTSDLSEVTLQTKAIDKFRIDVKTKRPSFSERRMMFDILNSTFD